MLIRFFLARFCKSFLLFFTLITLVLGASNMLVRMSMVITPSAFFILFVTMLPLMALFAFPLATALAIGTVVGDLFVGDELLLMRFLRPMQWALYRIIGIFSLMLVLVYTPLVWWLAPQSYLVGKQLLISVAKKQISQLEPQKFHTLLPGVTLFYHHKKACDGRSVLFNLFLTMRHKTGEQTLFTAHQGYVQNDILFLLNGSIHVLSSQRHYSATFNQSEIDLNKIVSLGKTDTSLKQSKFVTFTTLRNLMAESPEAWTEFYKRLTQIIWQLLLPFLALWGIFLFGRAKSNLLVTVAFSGTLFLVSYISTNMAAAVSSSPLAALCVLFCPLTLVIACVGYAYWRLF